MQKIAKTNLLIKAHDYANENKIIETDEVGVLSLINIKVKIIDGEYENIKVTTKKDLKGLYE